MSMREVSQEGHCLQYCHSHCEPKVLMADQMNAIQVPSTRNGIVGVSEDDEGP